MAEKRFIKGLFKDTAHVDQPAGTWRYARNMILNEKDGAVSNEGGTEIAGHLGEANTVGAIKDKVIGKIEVDDDKIILFILDVVLEENPRSEVGVWENNRYTPIFNPNVADFGDQVDLKFTEKNPIEGTYKIDGKGDLIVYWTDDLNPPRALNVDRQIRSNNITNNIALLYGINPNNSHKRHIDLLNLFPNSGPVPTIKLHDIYWIDNPHQNSVNTGGGLLTGVYYLALAYVDDDLVATNYLTVSNPVSIVDEYDHTEPVTKKDGAKHGSQTSKSIKWRCNNLNSDYKYLQAVVIRKMGDATEAFKLNITELAPQSNGNQDIVFSGLEGFQSSSVEDVIIDTISYETAKTINQLDGVLYLGNLTGTPDLGYQKYANNIKLTAKYKDFKNFDEFYATLDNLQNGFKEGEVNMFDGSVKKSRPSQSYRYIPNIFRWKGYTRDEVYAFYISFILNDGSMSYAYHIPGRGPTTDTKTMALRSSVGGDIDITENSKLSKVGADLTVASQIFKDLEKLSPEYSKNFHFFDFSTSPNSRNMNYWENATETYPKTDDYEVWDENGYTGTSNDLKGKNVRHHHFPSNENKEFQVVAEDKCQVSEEITSPGILPASGGFAAFLNVSQSPAPNGGVTMPNPGGDEYYNSECYVDCDDSTWRPLYFKSKHYKENPLTSPTADQNFSYSLFDQFWNGTTFTADQAMEVEVSLHVPIYGGPDGNVKDDDNIGFKAKVRSALSSGPHIQLFLGQLGNKVENLILLVDKKILEHSMGVVQQ